MMLNTRWAESRLKPLWLTLGILCLPGGAFAQTISLENFLQLVRANQPAYAREALRPQIEALRRDAFLGAQDISLAMTPFYILQNPLAQGTFTPEQVSQISAGTRLEKALWRTGGRLSLSWTSDFTDQTIQQLEIPGFGTISGGPPKFYQNNLALTYTQPLLQNFGGELDRLGYEMGQFNVSIAALQATENRESFLLDMALRFIDWVTLGEQRQIASERLDLARRQLNQVTEKRAANLVDRVDVLRSEDAQRIAEQGVVILDAQWMAKQAELAVLTRSTELAQSAPAMDLYARLEQRPLETYLAIINEQSRPLKVLRARSGQLERQQRGLAELTRPQLYLNAQLSLKGGAAELGSAFGMDKSDAGLFLQFNYPLGNRAALTNLQKNRLQQRGLALDRDALRLRLEAQLRSLLIQIIEMEKVLVLNEQQIETAGERTAAEEARYLQGRGDLAFVIQSQDSEAAARLAYVGNAASYQRLGLQLRALIDEIEPAAIPGKD